MKEIQELLSKFDGLVKIANEHRTQDVDIISTDSFFLDYKLGIGGIPTGLITEIMGEEGSGKTTLCTHLIKNAQKKFQDKMAAFVDVEHRFMLDYAEKIGVDSSRLLISQPESGENALDITEHLIRSGKVSIVVLDSVASLVTEAELEGDIVDQHYSALARLMSKTIKRLVHATKVTNTALVFTNQMRIVAMGPYARRGPTGGNALKFYSSIRIDLNRDKKLILSGKEPVAQIVNAKIIKNTLSTPFRETVFFITFGEGIDRVYEIIDFCLENNIFTKSGTWIKYKGEPIGQGRSATVQKLKQNKELLEEIENIVKDMLFL